MLFDVNWLVFFWLSAHIQKEESKVNTSGIAQHGINSVFGLSPMLSKFLDPKISPFSQSQFQYFDGGSVYVPWLFTYYEFGMFTEPMFILIKNLKCFYGVWFFYVFPMIIQSHIK